MVRKGLEAKSDFIDFIQRKFKKLEKKGVLISELAITDTYAFKKNNGYDHPLSLLNSCLQDLGNLNKMVFLINVDNHKYKDSNEVCSTLNEIFIENTLEKIDVIFDSDFHDRFWFLNKKKAFFVGASLNAIGSKHFFVQDNYFKRKDVKVLLDLCFNKDNYDASGNLRTKWCYEKQDGNWVDMTK